MSKKDKEMIENTSENSAENQVEISEEKAAKPKKVRNTRKLKYGSASVVVVVLVIAIVIVVNLMSGMLTKRYPLKLDLTSDNRYELSEESIELMKNLDKDIEITVTSTQDLFAVMSSQYEQTFYQYYGAIVEMPFEMIPEILDKYSVYAEAGSGSITVKYVDINKNPDVVTRLNKNYNGEITEGSIVLSCGDRVKVIDSTEVASMIIPSQNSTQTNIEMTFAGESTITSAIVSVADQNPVRAAVITTAGGNSIFDTTHQQIAASLESFLNKNGYECTEIDAQNDKISPEEYDLIVLACPNVDFTEDIIAKFSDFLYNGGKYQKNMIYVPNYYATNLPNITAFLEDWKISIDQSEIYDENMAQVSVSALNAVGYAPIIEVSDTESVGSLANDSLPLVAPAARPITILSKNNDSIITEVLKSSPTSYLSSLENEGEVSSEKAAYNVVVKSRRETAEQLDVYGSELLVIGSPFMLDNSLLSKSNSINNANVISNIINGMTGKETTAAIPEKYLTQSNLALTQASVRVTQVITIIVIPLLIAIIGAVILLWRKNK